MDESFQLPNEVSYSSQKYAGKVADREGMATKEYKADGTTRIKPVEIENNNIPPVTVDTKKHAQQATSLGRLKLVCVCLVISTVINAATFGGLIYDTVSFPTYRSIEY